jgi:transposase InsO family protein
MRRNGIRCRFTRRFIATTDSRHNEKIASNLLQRNFTTFAPNKVWVSDVTYIWTKKGWLYLSVTIDLYSRRVVGWSMSERLDSALVVNSLQSALSLRGNPKGLIHHSDQGKEYASIGFRAHLNAGQITQSMSRKGDCWDNAVAESFFKTIKTELIPKNGFATRNEARGKVFEWIEVNYNRQRLHSTLGYQSPTMYESKIRVS